METFETIFRLVYFIGLFFTGSIIAWIFHFTQGKTTTFTLLFEAIIVLLTILGGAISFYDL